MSDRSVSERGEVPQPESEGKHSPVAVADATFCELVALDLGIKPSSAKTAVLDEPTGRVLGVTSWALDNSEDPHERARMVIAWAKKRGQER